MARKVTFKGSPMTLGGRVLKLGRPAPDFKVIGQDLKDITLADFDGKIKVITTFLSLDTPVCDFQVKEFNKRASGLPAGQAWPGGDIVVIGISKDLPFAQKRFCEYNDIKNVTILSDYKYSIFGKNYGLLVKELNLLGRSIIIIDKNNILKYCEIVTEMTNPPNYEEALNSLKKIVVGV